MIDAHVHFWKYNKTRDAWITDDMKIIQRDFLPADLQPIISENNVDGVIAVQADQSEDETSFLLSLANENTFIKGIVGWVDLQNEDIEKKLLYYSQFPIIKGFRHIVQKEPAGFLKNKKFLNGIKKLETFGFTYDVLIYENQLNEAIEFVKRFPEQFFVVDHLAKPNIRESKIDKWEKEIKLIAAFPNVYCKLSGMATEADWERWSVGDFKPYIETVLENFGIDRVMFGSDWPVCLLAATYKQCCEILEENTIHFSEDEKRKLWGNNAIRFYNL